MLENSCCKPQKFVPCWASAFANWLPRGRPDSAPPPSHHHTLTTAAALIRSWMQVSPSQRSKSELGPTISVQDGNRESLVEELKPQNISYIPVVTVQEAVITNHHLRNRCLLHSVKKEGKLHRKLVSSFPAFTKLHLNGPVRRPSIFAPSSNT